MTKPELLEEQSSIANTDIIMATNSSNVTKKVTGQNVKMDLGAVNVALICSTAAVTAEKVVTGPSITLTTGVTFKVIFSNGNSASSPSINYNSVGALALKIYSGGSKINPSLSQMQAGTMLEVYFDGSDFVIMGNPIVYSSSDYTIYADGNIIYNDSRYPKYYEPNNLLYYGNGTYIATEDCYVQAIITSVEHIAINVNGVDCSSGDNVDGIYVSMLTGFFKSGTRFDSVGAYKVFGLITN